MDNDPHGESNVESFYNRKGAENALQIGQSIWSRDSYYADENRIVKQFYAATIKQLKSKLFAIGNPEQWNFYENLNSSHNHSLYLDIEFPTGKKLYPQEHFHRRLNYIGVTNQSTRDEYVKLFCEISSEKLKDNQCLFYTNKYVSLLKDFIKWQFPSHELLDDQFHVLTSCRPEKFSIHIIVKNLIFDANIISMRYFVWEFDKNFWCYLNKEFTDLINDNPSTATLSNYQKLPVRFMFLDCCGNDKSWSISGFTGIDPLVYTKSQDMRIIGNRKIKLSKNQISRTKASFDDMVPLTYVPFSNSNELLEYKFLQNSNVVDEQKKFELEQCLEKLVPTLITYNPNPHAETDEYIYRLKIETSYPKYLETRGIITNSSLFYLQQVLSVDDFQRLHPEKKYVCSKKFWRIRSPHVDDRQDVVAKIHPVQFLSKRKRDQSMVNTGSSNNSIQASISEIDQANRENIEVILEENKKRKWNSPVIDDDYFFYTTDGVKKMLYDVEDNEVLFHDCDSDLFYANKNEKLEDYQRYSTNNQRNDEMTLAERGIMIDQAHNTLYDRPQIFPENRLTSPLSNYGNTDSIVHGSPTRIKPPYKVLSSQSSYVSALSQVSDTSNAQNCGINDIEGTPCMVMLPGRHACDNRLLKCWACGAAYWVIPTYHSKIYATFPRLIVRRPYKEYMTEGWSDEKKDEFYSQMEGKLVVFQAPCGSGKTHTMMDFIKYLLKKSTFEEDQYQKKSLGVLVSVSRKALAISIGRDPNLISYTEISGTEEEIYSQMKKASMCCNSTGNIPRALLRQYDMVFVDEARFFREHIVTDVFMRDKRRLILQRLTTIFRSCTTLVIAQDRLHERDVLYFAKQRGIDNIYEVGPNLHQIKFEWTEKPKRKIYISTSKDVIIDRILKYLKTFGNSKKVVINVTSISDGNMLLKKIQTMITLKEIDIKNSRLQFLYGKDQDNGWCAEFLKNPNGMANSFDVLICSPVMQAGQSLDNCINKVFGLFNIKLLTHEKENQMLERSRCHDLMEVPEIYVGVGVTDRMCASYEHNKMFIDMVGFEDELLVSAQSDVLGEKADSTNRHFWLWYTDQDWEAHVLPIPDEATRHAQRLQTIKMKQEIGVRSYITDYYVNPPENSPEAAEWRMNYHYTIQSRGSKAENYWKMAHPKSKSSQANDINTRAVCNFRELCSFTSPLCLESDTMNACRGVQCEFIKSCIGYFNFQDLTTDNRKKQYSGFSLRDATYCRFLQFLPLGTPFLPADLSIEFETLIGTPEGKVCYQSIFEHNGWSEHCKTSKGGVNKKRCCFENIEIPGYSICSRAPQKDS